MAMSKKLNSGLSRTNPARGRMEGLNPGLYHLCFVHLTFFQNLDLTEKTLVYEGPLTLWNKRSPLFDEDGIGIRKCFRSDL